MTQAALEHRVAITARALFEHDCECTDFACILRDGCRERVALMKAHNDAMNDYVEAFP